MNAITRRRKLKEENKDKFIVETSISGKRFIVATTTDLKTVKIDFDNLPRPLGHTIHLHSDLIKFLK
jgi:hypothetical protein